MVSIKLQLCGHYGYHNPDDFQAKAQCLFTLYAVHAYKHLSPFCAIREDLVPVACVGVYCARRCC
jgi:hypothetical protein